MIAMGNLKSGLSLFYLHFLTHGYLSVKVATTPSNCDATEVTPSSISMKKKRNEKSWGHQSIATKPSGKTTNTRPGPAVTKSLMGTPVMCWNVKLKDIKIIGAMLKRAVDSMFGRKREPGCIQVVQRRGTRHIWRSVHCRNKL